MECPHLEDSARIAFDLSSTTTDSLGKPPVFKCSACQTEESPWICLTCGDINCGRYIKGHAKEHHENHEKLHAVCMDCHSLMAFCYKCDDFVINDTNFGHLEKLRKQYESLTKVTETKSEESCSSQVTSPKKVQRCDSSDSLENERNHKKRKRDNHHKQRRPRTSGLRNLGNTCFMNAVLQSLSNIQEFCGYIKQLPSLEDKIHKAKKIQISRKTRDSGEDVLLVEELRKTLVALWQGTKGAISPESLFSVIWKVVPRFRGYQQQDAHEFMRYLLDRLHIELLELLPYPNNNSPYIGPKGKSTIVTAIFGGLLQSEVNCLICGMESKKHDPFLDLSLDIPAQFSSRLTKPKDGEPICTLTDCLSSFTDIEELEDSELYMCNNCKQRQRSTKKFWIRRLPNVLCLHLKRFRWSMFCRLKVETFVEFPIQALDMNTYVLNNLHETRGSFSGSNLYDLAAVIVHHGSGAGSGHYTAYATHEGQWYHFNDSTVTACDVDTVMRCKAYILFYVRREIRLPDSLCARTHSSLNRKQFNFSDVDSETKDNHKMNKLISNKTK
ncbi:ubiquitin carboxyl-terminal hydrolase 3-like [Physella acuta]|uniref:ubiquitin carboxyl-terminal hydrolase 3-like n=1 Tax=Physella acuta TaxID=109671 RepID=UPI0027DD81EA|nr:ubiquitin carboxyl-terminal hydrolase 3-like [Physella acuta]XP_059171693.1 ubiquitin carboxyl-terminal hydrolase 3-like [Physella acuta]XP_059171694.1 ubiquitin carboxyl-terminal hydrolase 3-like [Physella acuta]